MPRFTYVFECMFCGRLLCTINSNFPSFCTCAVFFVSATSGFEVHTFSTRPPPGFEAQQPSSKRQLWFKDLWLWSGSNHVRDRLHDRVCCNPLVQSPRIAPQLFRVYSSNRCVVGRLHIYGTAEQRAFVPRQRLCATAPTNYGGNLTGLQIPSMFRMLSGSLQNKSVRQCRNHFYLITVSKDQPVEADHVLPSACDQSMWFYGEWQLIGSPEDSDLGFLRSDNARRYMKQLPRFARQPFDRKFPKMQPAAVDLVEQILRFDPARRITVEQALSHPYLQSLHDINDEPICHSPFEFDFEQPSFNEEHIKELIMMEAIAFNPGESDMMQ